MIFEFHRMDKNNSSLWVWFDVRINDRYFVFRWRKGLRPYLYSSQDATPTNAKCYFGRRAMLED